MQNRVLIPLLLLLILFKTRAQSLVLNSSDSLLAYGNYTKAIAVLQTHSNQKEVYYKLAKAYSALGNFDDALVNYNKAVVSEPDNILVKYHYGKLLTNTKRYHEASVLFNTLVKVDSLNSNYHYELGVNLEAQGNIEEAQQHFEKAFIIDSTHQKAIYQLAKFQLKKAQHKNVNRLVNIGLKTYPNNVSLISLKAQSLYSKKYYAKAIIWFEKLVALGERNKFVFKKLSVAYTKELEYKKAIFNLEKVVNLDPKNTSNLYLLGDLYFKVEDYINAEKYIKRSLELQDEPLDREYNKLASTYNYLKKPEQAVVYYKKSLKENPDNESTIFYLLLTKDSYYKDIDARMKLHENYIKNYPNSHFVKWAKEKLNRLKAEKFMSVDGNKN